MVVVYTIDNTEYWLVAISKIWLLVDMCVDEKYSFYLKYARAAPHSWLVTRAAPSQSDGQSQS